MLTFKNILPLMLASFLLMGCGSSILQSQAAPNSLRDLSNDCPNLPPLPAGVNVGGVLKHEVAVIGIYNQCRAHAQALSTAAALPAK